MTTTKHELTGTQVTLGGTVYVIADVDTVEAMDERHLEHIARFNRDRGIAANLIIRRPKGSVDHLAYLLDSGRIVYGTRLR